MTAGRIVDILLDAVDPKFMQNFVQGSFSVRLDGLSNQWTGSPVCGAILYGDGRFTLLNENRDVVFRTKHFSTIEKDPGYYGSYRVTKSFPVKNLQRMYPNLVGEVIKVWATTKDPRFKDRPTVEYEGVVQKR